MKAFRQILAASAMNLRSLPQRASTSLVIVIGIAGVVGVLVSMLAMSTGMIRTLQNSGRADRVIVLRKGSAAEASSAISRNDLRLIGDAVGVKRDADGKPVVSPEALRPLTRLRKDDGSEVNAAIRGVGAKMTAMRPEFKIVAGRMFQPALAEIVVGQGAYREFRGLEIGEQIKTRGATYTVVGVFTTGGDAHESELFTDVDAFIAAERRGGYQSVNLMLESPGAFKAFKDSITSNPALSLDVTPEPEYYRQQSRQITRIINAIAYIVGAIMAIGAMFGALNTMYSAVSARLREIATLRAIGFGSVATVTSVLLEAVLLSLAGGVIGAGLAWAIFNGYAASTTMGIGGHLVFDLSVSPLLIGIGILWAVVIGLIGGVLPAWRAASLPVAEALRAV